MAVNKRSPGRRVEQGAVGGRGTARRVRTGPRTPTTSTGPRSLSPAAARRRGDRRQRTRARHRMRYRSDHIARGPSGDARVSAGCGPVVANARHARRRATGEGIDNGSFEHADAEIHPFETGTFDLAISNTGATFFGDLVAGPTNIHRALRPRGRLVLLTWQPLENNEWVREFTSVLAAGRGLPGPAVDVPSPFAVV